MNAIALQALRLVYQIDAALERYEDDGIADPPDGRGRQMQPRLHHALVMAEKRHHRRGKMPEIVMATVGYQIQYGAPEDVRRAAAIRRARFE